MSSAPQSSPQQPLSLYRRHRPRRFQDVVGRDAVVRTLRNAVQRGKVHHAYLFVGSRGTGKTSIAKILAACLNCERRDPAAGEAAVDACGVCESCVSIAEARSLDVIEMDAASNNSVEDIRDLRDSVAYSPISGRSKVYILDEAHMLSTAAWNAFLKTLEEPPPNTVFVLATTEAQKVPATVVDRCHRFDFHRPTVEQVASVIRRTAAAESVVIPPEALAAVARASDGSFRDALGTLEQLITYSGSEIALQDVLAVLGVADVELIERTLDAVASGDARGTLLAVEECASSGRDASALASDLEARARELLIVQVLGEVPAELSLTEEADERLLQQSARIGQPALVRLLDLLAAALEAVKAGGDARTQVELALLKAARPEVDPSTKALLARIERLEDGAPGVPTQAGAAPQQAPSPLGAPADAPMQRTQAPAQEAPAPAQSRPPAPPARQSSSDISSLKELWPAVVDLVRSDNALLGAVIEEAQPSVLHEGELTVAFPPRSSFNKRKAEDPPNRVAVAEAIARLSGASVRLAYTLSEEAEQQDPASGQGDAEEDIVKKIMVEFDAEELPEGWVPEQRE